jgi:hypothetical protein
VSVVADGGATGVGTTVLCSGSWCPQHADDDWRGSGLGPPLTARLPPLKTTRHSNTIDNKIDNVKAKIQDKEERKTWSRPTLARHPVFGQLAASPTSFPLEEPPRRVSASHDESPPHTMSLRLAREVSASHEKSGPDWRVGPDARH